MSVVAYKGQKYMAILAGNLVFGKKGQFEKIEMEGG
jgi:hypothetical protein